VVSLAVVELTAQSVSEVGSQLPRSIDQKLSVRNVIMLGEAMKERRRGIGPAAAVHVEFLQQLRLRVNRGVQPLLFTVHLNLFLVDRDPRRRRQVALGVEE
jgi:hypothetical protein